MSDTFEYRKMQNVLDAGVRELIDVALTGPSAVGDIKPDQIQMILGIDVDLENISTQHRAAEAPQNRHKQDEIQRNSEEVPGTPVTFEDYQRYLLELFYVQEGLDSGTVPTVEVEDVIEESDDDDEYELPAQRVSLN